MPAPKTELLRAIELALANQWDAAHEIVQQYEDDATAAWIHAVLHKMEGDLGNARYWYRHADRMEHGDLSRQSETAADDEPRAELVVIKTKLCPGG